MLCNFVLTDFLQKNPDSCSSLQRSIGFQKLKTRGGRVSSHNGDYLDYSELFQIRRPNCSFLSIILTNFGRESVTIYNVIMSNIFGSRKCARKFENNKFPPFTHGNCQLWQPIFSHLLTRWSALKNKWLTKAVIDHAQNV